MGIIALLGCALLGALVVQLVAYVYALRTSRVDVIDVGWGLSFIAAVVVMQLYEPSTSLWVVMTDLLVFIWGVRLSWHIYRRFSHSAVQDARYTELIRHWPQRLLPLQLFLRLFVVQAFLAVLISLPVVVVHAYQPATSWLAVVGLMLWLVGFITESVADKQLRDFLVAPDHGELMTDGLWRYSRHPNYFGEIIMWWGIALIASQTPLWWLGILGALTITILIRFVSGVPLAEARSRSKRGWSEYARQTSTLLPLPLRK